MLAVAFEQSPLSKEYRLRTEDRVDVKDDAGSGAPCTVTIDENAEAVNFNKNSITHLCLKQYEEFVAKQFIKR